MIKSILLMMMLVLPAQAATVIVQVNKVKSAQGDIRASLCETEVAYKADKCIKEIVLKAQKGTTQLVFENVTPGTYGIQLMHDKNANGDMDFNFLGIPKEGYGFSNNAKPRLSQPSFQRISFAVGDATVTQSIDLIN
jgi:uncharacterized protein (DUF2141 family)